MKSFLLISDELFITGSRLQLPPPDSASTQSMRAGVALATGGQAYEGVLYPSYCSRLKSGQFRRIYGYINITYEDHTFDLQVPETVSSTLRGFTDRKLAVSNSD